MDRRTLIGSASAGLTLAAFGSARAQAQTAYDFSFNALEGGALPLSQFAGRALLVVNTASACGYTGQYSGLRDLQERFASAPFTIVGVPSNNFGGQEPGSSEDIRQLCDGYRVQFPMAEKTVVVGEGRHPFYAWAEETIGAEAVPQWNFHKILIDRTGRGRRGVLSRVDPASAEFIGYVEETLTQV